MATPRLAESGSRLLPDSPSRGVSDSLISRVGESPTLRLTEFFFWTFKSRLPDSPSRWVVDSPTRRVVDSPTRRVRESATPRLVVSESRRLADSPSRGVVFRLRISPRIRSQKRNGSKDSVRDLWGPNFCKNPRKSVSLPCPFKIGIDSSLL